MTLALGGERTQGGGATHLGDARLLIHNIGSMGDEDDWIPYLKKLVKWADVGGIVETGLSANSVDELAGRAEVDPKAVKRRP